MELCIFASPPLIFWRENLGPINQHWQQDGPGCSLGGWQDAMSQSALAGLLRTTLTKPEQVVGKDVEPAAGLRVRIAARYAADTWARDETGGRCGTIVAVGQGSQPACDVRWDRADGRDWEAGCSLELASKYTGQYRCGSNGCYHLALAPGQLSVDHEAITAPPTRNRSKMMQASATENR